jgi:O-antigen/teichoic acid export membrane protein
MQNDTTLHNLKERVVRGSFAKVCAQGAIFALRLGSLMVLARLLSPKDFGLVGMVTALTGVLNLFRDFGLSAASVQRATISDEQISTLFWINALVGAILALLVAAMAPLIAAFYHEPRLVSVTIVLATSFLFNAAGVQHSALLQRQMRFTALAFTDIISLVVSVSVAIGMAEAGFGYWALVASAVCPPLVTTLCLWFTTGWIPGRPRSGVGIHSMMRFGGTMTLNGLVVYIAYNFEKVLLGRFWGTDAVGLYGRSFQLINIPTDNLNSTVGEVAFSALSRVRDDPKRLKSYFLKGYSLVLALTIPITVVCALFADDLILVLLGPKWKDAISIFRLLAPTIVIFALINPLGWLLFSLGMLARSLKIALVLAPLVITGYIVGLPYGPRGVAFAYSAVMALWVIPHVMWCVHGTVISFRDVVLTASRPMLSAGVAAALAFGVQFQYGRLLSPLLRLVSGCGILFSVYILMLLYVMGQKVFYVDLIKGLGGRASVDDKILVAT